MAQYPPVGQGLLIIAASRSHSRQTPLGRTPLDEWSARRRDLYLTKHSFHKRQTSMPPMGFEHAVPASDRSQTHAFDSAATGIYFQYGTIDKVHIAHDCKSVICYCVSTSTLLFIAQERMFFFKNCDVSTTMVTRPVQLSSSFSVRHSNKKFKRKMHSKTKAIFHIRYQRGQRWAGFHKLCVSFVWIATNLYGWK
jgi:hypothetical protein